MTFPDKRFPDPGSYADAYFAVVRQAAASVDREKLREAAVILTTAYREGGTVFACGNGGSAALADQLVADHCKLVQTDTWLTPRVHSLSSSIDIITAVANDLSYDEVFAYQLRSLARPGDVLVTISSSGDSENIVRVASWAKDNGLTVISLTGFSGGRSAAIADVDLHVDADNYGVIEDVHQSLMHILAQYIRHDHMDDDTIRDRKF
ncbi:MAG TPA: SIS domain-containing protein [Thermoleophilia bacterium]|nr:SIS domain-containing protein [Thermoleophilia bacterium]